MQAQGDLVDLSMVFQGKASLEDILSQNFSDLSRSRNNKLNQDQKYTPSTAGNSMTGSERPSPEPLLKKEASPAVLGGERILETLWKPQMP